MRLLKKKKWMATALLAAALLAAGCSRTPPSGEGFVLERSGDSAYVVIGEMTADDIGRTWNELFADGYSGEAIVLRTADAGLKPGDKVKYWIDGGVNASYPAQASAKKIEKTGDIDTKGGH